MTDRGGCDVIQQRSLLTDIHNWATVLDRGLRITLNKVNDSLMTYQSRHQPRRQQTSGGKIKNAEQYDVFYDIAFDAMIRSDFPTMTVDTGKLMLRVVKATLTIEQARTIPPGSSMDGNNRFSGPRLDGRNGQGALYVGTDK